MTRYQKKLPHPRRDGSAVFLDMPDGSVIPLEPIEASELAKEWTETVAGAYVRLSADTEAAEPHPRNANALAVRHPA